ncbi:MAG: rRNA maturation RNase YbeY [Acidimicrobiia bacterium]
MDVIAVDVRTIIELNRQHMGDDGPTDVLSFPLDDPSEGDSFGFRPHVGDIVVCPKVALQQAANHAGTVEAELHLLVIHSALHLLGHDHITDAERHAMQTKEQVHLERLGFSHPGDQK